MEAGEGSGCTKRALRRHWTTSGGRDWEVVPKADGVDLEKRREVMASDAEFGGRWVRGDPRMGNLADFCQLLSERGIMFTRAQRDQAKRLSPWFQEQGKSNYAQITRHSYCQSLKKQLHG